MADIIYINDIDVKTYGLTFLDGTYAELRKPAKVKEQPTNNWPEEDGTERDTALTKLESRTLNLPCLLEGNNESDFIAKHQALFELLLGLEYFQLKVERLNRIYTLLYQDASSYKDYNNHATFVLVLVDDYPATVTPIV